MLLTPFPVEVTTNEAGIMFLVAKLIQAQASAGTLPLQITEQAGYYPSDLITAVPLRTVDGGNRQVIRILMPVNAGYFGSSLPIWQFTGQLVS